MSSPSPEQSSNPRPGEVERLFFALWPDDEVRQAIRRHAKDLLRHSGGRPVVLENLHITLAFLGSVDAAQRQCVERVAEAIALPAFALQLDQVGYWSRPRVLWLGAHETPDIPVALAKQLAQGCRDCGLSLDRRPFKAHLTLKRKVHQAPPAMEVRPVSWPVESFVLVRSRTLPEGVQYQVVREWRLGPENSAPST